SVTINQNGRSRSTRTVGHVGPERAVTLVRNTQQDGTDDRRRHVDPQNAPKHPTLPIHKHDPKKK
ncbi:MAG: hypothetical protein DI603_11815, partial [Roseateles depolymerans]